MTAAERAAVRPLLVAELFGPTFQGEGPSAGQQAMFVRLSRCNLSCPSCDTPYTWDTSRFDLRVSTTRRDPQDVAAWALRMPTSLVVVTGGEPLLQQQALLPLVTVLNRAGRRVEVETNGTITPTAQLSAQVTAFNVSPKLAGFAASGDADRRINREALLNFVASGKSVFKFVASSLADLDEIDSLQQRFGLDPVWVMPEGIASGVVMDHMRALADAVLARGWNLTTRLHVLLWEDTRGR